QVGLGCGQCLKVRFAVGSQVRDLGVLLVVGHGERNQGDRCGSQLHTPAVKQLECAVIGGGDGLGGGDLLGAVVVLDGDDLSGSGCGGLIRGFLGGGGTANQCQCCD